MEIVKQIDCWENSARVLYGVRELLLHFLGCDANSNGCYMDLFHMYSSNTTIGAIVRGLGDPTSFDSASFFALLIYI